MATHSSTLGILFLLIRPIWMQQFRGKPMGMPYNVSESCLKALNTGVDCPFGLADVAASHGTIDPGEIIYLCGTSCLASLQSARSIIATACDPNTDIVVFNDIDYPATYFVDNYILTYEVKCRTDNTTGELCEPQFAQWKSPLGFTINQSCSDCWLGIHQMQLAHPLGYDPSLASTFDTLTSFCNATQYTYATPSAYGRPHSTTAHGVAAASATATTSPPCTGLYTVQPEDTCESVSQKLNVSTYSLVHQNNIDLYCRMFTNAVGKPLCIPETCETYTWQAYDNCDAIASAFPPMTVPQFLAWNPTFNSLCTNGVNFHGYQVCVSPPGGWLNQSAHTNSSISTAASARMPIPTSAMTRSE